MSQADNPRRPSQSEHGGYEPKTSTSRRGSTCSVNANDVSGNARLQTRDQTFNEVCGVGTGLDMESIGQGPYQTLSGSGQGRDIRAAQRFPQSRDIRCERACASGRATMSLWGCCMMTWESCTQHFVSDKHTITWCDGGSML